MKYYPVRLPSGDGRRLIPETTLEQDLLHAALTGLDAFREAVPLANCAHTGRIFSRKQWDDQGRCLAHVVVREGDDYVDFLATEEYPLHFWLAEEFTGRLVAGWDCPPNPWNDEDQWDVLPNLPFLWAPEPAPVPVEAQG